MEFGRSPYLKFQGIHWPTKDEPDREAQELGLGRLAATMDSDEEDSAEEDDEGASPTGADATIFDDDISGFEGLLTFFYIFINVGTP